MTNKMPYGVSNIPTSRFNLAGYRTVNSSKKYNENQDAILNDILDLYNKTNELEKELSESRYIIECENKYLSLKVAELTQELNSVRNNTINSGNEKTDYIYPSTVSCPRVLPANVDILSNDITITPSSSSSKVRVESEYDDSIFIPPSLQVSLSDISGAGILKVEDGNTDKAFDGRNDTVWVRKVVAKNTVNSIETIMTITLPEDIVTTFNINEIKLSPFPLNSLNIAGVSSRVSNGIWNSIPSFNEHASCSNNSIKDAGVVKFNFKNVVANQVQIKVVQDKYIVENGNRVFYLGFSDIDIRTNKYIDKSNHFSFDINIPASVQRPTILGLDAIYNNKSQLAGNSTQYEFLYEGSDGLMHKVRDSIPFVAPVNKLQVKAKIFNGDSTPSIAKFRLKYKSS